MPLVVSESVESPDPTEAVQRRAVCVSQSRVRADQTDLVGEYDQRDPVTDTRLGQDPADVGLDRRLGEEELRRRSRCY